MKSRQFFRGFTLSAIVLASFAFQGNAAIQSLTMGNTGSADIPLNFLSTTPGVANDPNNPNLFPVYFAESAIGSFGFVLDGTEWAKTLAKRFEDARASTTNVTIYYDDISTNGFKIAHNMWAPNTQAAVFKIVYVSTFKR